VKGHDVLQKANTKEGEEFKDGKESPKKSGSS